MAKGKHVNDDGTGKGGCCGVFWMSLLFVFTLLALLGIVFGLVLDFLGVFCIFGSSGSSCDFGTFVPTVRVIDDVRATRTCTAARETVDSFRRQMYTYLCLNVPHPLQHHAADPVF